MKSKSKDSSCLICGRSDHFWRQCPERHSKGSGKGGKNGSRTFYLGTAWGFDSELFEDSCASSDHRKDDARARVVRKRTQTSSREPTTTWCRVQCGMPSSSRVSCSASMSLRPNDFERRAAHELRHPQVLFFGPLVEPWRKRLIARSHRGTLPSFSHPWTNSLQKRRFRKHTKTLVHNGEKKSITDTRVASCHSKFFASSLMVAVSTSASS